jgi:hypothetical protein
MPASAPVSIRWSLPVTTSSPSGPGHVVASGRTIFRRNSPRIKRARAAIRASKFALFCNLEVLVISGTCGRGSGDVKSPRATQSTPAGEIPGGRASPSQRPRRRRLIEALQGRRISFGTLIMGRNNDRECGAPRGGQVRFKKIGACSPAARHAVECVECGWTQIVAWHSVARTGRPSIRAR